MRARTLGPLALKQPQSTCNLSVLVSKCGTKCRISAIQEGGGHLNHLVDKAWGKTNHAVTLWVILSQWGFGRSVIFCEAS